MEHKMFDPNYDKPLYEIKIVVFENCNTMTVVPIDRHPTYHEVVGALETQKHGIMDEQRILNKKEYSKRKKK